MAESRDVSADIDAAMNRLNSMKHPSDGGDFVAYRLAQAAVFRLQADSFQRFADRMVADGDEQLGARFRDIASSSLRMSQQIEKECADLSLAESSASSVQMTLHDLVRQSAHDPEEVFRDLKADADRLKDDGWPSLCLPAHRRNGKKKVRLSGSALVARGLRRAALALRRANR